MILTLPNVLTAEHVVRAREALLAADWMDGRITSGHLSTVAKNNSQLREDSPAARGVGQMILAALERSPLFFSAALPARIVPPLFNRYEGGQQFGMHIDNAVRRLGTTGYVRTDLSATVFLTDPVDYDGGELVVEDTYGAHAVKLPAGSMVLYPASSLHRVQPVTRGQRLASFFWIQSMVRDDGERTLLFDLDSAIRSLGTSASGTQHPSAVPLANVYHNLLRRWAEV